MKNILSIAFILVAFAANGQKHDYVIEASDSLITRGVLQVGADKFKATTQVSSDDTTLVSLDYLTGLLENAEYADSLAFHSGTGYLVYYREGVALDSTSLDGRYQTTLTNPVTGTGTVNYLPKWTGLSTLGNSLIFDNGTNVGLGTIVPGSKFTSQETLAGGATYPIQLNNVSASIGTRVGLKLGPSNAPDVRYAAIEAYQQDGNNSIGLSFITGIGATITEKAKITAEGFFGLNTEPSTRFDLKSGIINVGNSGVDGAFNEVIRVGISGYTGIGNWRNSIYSSLSSSIGGSILKFSLANSRETQLDVMTLVNSGNVGIGTTAPAQKLDVNGNIRVRGVGTNTTSTLLGLDSNGDLTTNVSITGGATWKGGWNASTNTPTLSDATGTNGWWYKVTTAGTQNLGSGSITFAVGDDVIHNGTIWQKYSAMISEADPVFVASDVYNWTTTDSINWATAYSWGDHETAGYLTAEVDGSVINELQNLSLGTTTTTTQPINISSGTGITLPSATTAAAGLMSATDKTNLNTIVGYGNPSGQYLPLSGGTMANTNRVVNMNADLLDDRNGIGYVRHDLITGQKDANIIQIGSEITSEYRWLNTASNSDIANLHSTRYSDDWVWQEFNTMSSSPQKYIRSRHSGTSWTNWYKVFHEGNFTDNSTNWNTAYNDRIASAAFSGTTTKTLTLTQQDGGTVTANFTDLVDDADASVTNEGSLTVTAGTATTSVINSNTSGNTPVTLSVDGTNLGISEVGNTISLSNLKPDQTVSLAGSGATSVTGTYPNFTISSTDNNTTYTGSAGVQLVGNDFRMNIGSLTTGAISASTHYIPWYQTTGAHWRTTLAELQAVAGYNAGKIQNVTVSSTAPTTDYVLKYNGTTWAPAPDATGSSLTSGDAINVTGDSINYKPTRITATMTDLNMLNNAASIVTNFEYGGAIYRTTLSQLASLNLYNARAVQGYFHAANTPDVGDVWKWDGTQYAPAPDATGGMTDPMTTRGDIIYRNSSNATARLGRGTAGQLLYSNGTDLSWRTPVKADIGLGNVENTALSTWTGSTNLSTVGSITQGNWNADPIGVTKGGTGKTSYTAYALLAGGTTSTGTLQQVAGVGTSGQVLTSNGADALPSWQAAQGGGWTDEGDYLRLNTFADRVTIGGGSDPTPYKLQVVGDAIVTGTLTTNYEGRVRTTSGGGSLSNNDHVVYATVPGASNPFYMPETPTEGKTFILVNAHSEARTLKNFDNTANVSYRDLTYTLVSTIPAYTSVTLMYISGTWYRIQ